MNTQILKQNSFVFILVAVLMAAFGTQNNSYAQEGNPTITASVETPLTEVTLSGRVVTLMLSKGQFAREFYVSRALTISGIDGVTFDSWDVDRINDTKVTIELTFSGNIDVDTPLIFTIGAEGIAEYDGVALTTQLTVTAVEETLVASTTTPLTETTLSGSIVKLTLSGRSFDSSRYDIARASSISGIEGVTGSFRRISNTEVTITLTFSGNIDTDSILTITVGADAIVGYNEAFTIQLPVTAVAETLVATTEAPLTETNLHGNVVTLTLSGRRFAGKLDIDDALMFSGIEGVTVASWVDIDRVSDTKVTIPLTFSGNIDTDATLIITVGGNAIGGYTKGFSFEFPVAAVKESLVATTDAPLTEATLSGGVVTLTLGGRRFTDSEWDIKEALTVNGIEGVTIAQGFWDDGVERVSNTVVTVPLRFSGNIDADGTLTITVGANAIVGINQAFTAQLPVTAVEETLAATTEKNPHLNVVKLTLSGRQFAGGWTIKDTLTISSGDGGDVEILHVAFVSAAEMTVSLGLNGDINNDIILTITLGTDAISGYTGPALTTEVTVTPIPVSLIASTETISLEATLREGEIVRTESPLTEANFLFAIRLTLSGRPFIADRWSDALTFSSPDGRIVGLSEDETEVEINGEIIELDEIDDVENLNDIGIVSIDDVEHVSASEVLIYLVFWSDLSADATLTLTLSSDAILGYNEDFTFEFPVTAIEESLTATTEFTLTEENLNGSNVRLSSGRKIWASLDLDDIEEGNLTISGIEGVTIEDISFPWSGWILSMGDPTITLGFDGDFDTDATLTITVGAGTIAGYNKGLTVELPVIATQQSDATVSVSPSPIALPGIGEKLTLNLDITNGENVAGYQATVWFDDSALLYVESANGDYLPANAFFTGYTTVTGYTPLEDTSSLTIAGNTLAGARNGDGTLATLTFEVLGYKPSTVTLVEVYLVDADGKQWEVTSKNGEVIEPPELEKKIFGDLNLDGVVDVQDLSIIKDRFGQTGQNIADVNGDLLVDIVDLVLVAGAFGNGIAAPSLHSDELEVFTAADVQQWLSQAKHLNRTDPKVKRGILFLMQLHSVLTPKENALLVNFPNPFNPETWIPFQLARPADVNITIYAVDGQMIRRIELGHQHAGRYHNRSRAAYWDGKNILGEPVTSGVYFYTLTAGDFIATRKMLIRK